MKLEELSIADLQVIKKYTSDKIYYLPSNTDQKMIDYWDKVYIDVTEEITKRITEIFPLP